MKSHLYTILAIEAALYISGTQPGQACGPYFDDIPTPEYFAKNHIDEKSMSDYFKAENLRLWQSATSERIPLSDIEQAVYHDSNRDLYNYTGDSNNLFYRYLGNTRHGDMVSFLDVAKRVERFCHDLNYRSPWYYPSSRYSGDDDVEYSSAIIDKDIEYEIKHCDDQLLRERYFLQKTRLLFAQRKYQACIEYVDSVFGDVPADHLMRRMATRYAAGSWYRLDNTQRADSLYASAGDIWSLSVENSMEYMAKANPDAPQLMEYIRFHAYSPTALRQADNLADRLLAEKRVKNRGDWYFLRAYTALELDEDTIKAGNYIDNAVKETFADEQLSHQAMTFKARLDLLRGNFASLYANISRAAKNLDCMSADYKERIRYIGNVIYADAIPLLWQKGDYATAIYLCAFADKLFNPESAGADHGSLTTQLMQSLSSKQLIAAYGRMSGGSALFNFLSKRAPISRDYVYEMIGTLAMREGDYGRAEQYLSRVSTRFLQAMNVYRQGYLGRDAFKPYGKRGDEYTYDDGSTYRYVSSPVSHDKVTLGNADAKLRFARQMRGYQRTMKSDRNPDRRAMARIMYAIGRRNSFEECWALTQYWDGMPVTLFSPSIEYYGDDFARDNYGFLENYSGSQQYKEIEKTYRTEIAEAMAMFATDEARAEAEYLMGNVKTVVLKYPDTPTGQYVKTHCDHWRAWL